MVDLKKKKARTELICQFFEIFHIYFPFGMSSYFLFICNIAGFIYIVILLDSKQTTQVGEHESVQRRLIKRPVLLG